ncbi:DNA cytosine methyltransferase, partial [Escherichia coli]
IDARRPAWFVLENVKNLKSHDKGKTFRIIMQTLDELGYDVAAALQWAIKNDRFVISLCHGPAAFLALRHSDNPLNGYSICAFPDAADKQTPDIGYMPGHLTWYFGEELKKMGMNIINDDITGRVHKDRKLLTGDSPFAANALGKLAAQEMLAAYAS